MSFMKTTYQEKGYLNYIKKIDMSSYTTRGSGWTSHQSKEMIKAQDIAYWIKHCRYLEQLMIGDELMNVFVEPELIQSIFNYDPHPYLKVIDFTGFCDQTINEKLATIMFNEENKEDVRIEEESKKEQGDAEEEVKDVLDVHLQQWMNIPPQLSQLSFHMCMALSPSLFFLPFFKRLALNGNTITRLDLAYTPITNQVFDYLDPSQLTHLNLQGCKYISCCNSSTSSSNLISFLLKATNLIELNLNMHFNGTPNDQQFCESCLSSLLSKQHTSTLASSLKVLDLGGHGHLKDHHLQSISPLLLQQLLYFSIAYNSHITYPTLISILPKMKQLQYINVTKTKSIQPMFYPIFNHPQLPNNLQVMEVDNPKNTLSPKINSHQKKEVWNLHQYGRRCYYAKNNTDPRFKYSQKLLMMDEQPQSPMMKYWSFSY
ncbi:hypothetical protein BJ944DRAFT_273877 [Cunninghamella echinulata]|nr:hypothetical protein BJ944DRAFT_273877 [Cunninghamella echinulata]